MANAELHSPSCKEFGAGPVPVPTHANPCRPMPTHADPCRSSPTHAGRRSMPVQPDPCRPMAVHAGPARPMPVQTDPCRSMAAHAGPARPVPARAGPARPMPAHGGPCRSGPAHAGPCRSSPTHAGPARSMPVHPHTGPCRAPTSLWPHKRLSPFPKKATLKDPTRSENSVCETCVPSVAISLQGQEFASGVEGSKDASLPTDIRAPARRARAPPHPRL